MGEDFPPPFFMSTYKSLIVGSRSGIGLALKNKLNSENEDVIHIYRNSEEEDILDLAKEFKDEKINDQKKFILSQKIEVLKTLGLN